MLYEPFNRHETYHIYDILHIPAKANIPHRKAGYYLLHATQVPLARLSGLLLINSDGDQIGYQLPLSGPHSSLGEAISQIQPPPPPIEGVTYTQPAEPEPLSLDDLLKIKAKTPKPIKYCLCGSTSKAQDAFESERLRLTLAGAIVLTIGADAKDSDLGITADRKNQLDVLHLYKIDEADRVRILNPEGYIGNSTRRELEYARRLGKQIEFLEEPNLAQPDQEPTVTAAT